VNGVLKSVISSLSIFYLSLHYPFGSFKKVLCRRHTRFFLPSLSAVGFKQAWWQPLIYRKWHTN
jgi:hypothetical protein